jgi:hypothetical protein
MNMLYQGNQEIILSKNSCDIIYDLSFYKSYIKKNTFKEGKESIYTERKDDGFICYDSSSESIKSEISNDSFTSNNIYNKKNSVSTDTSDLNIEYDTLIHEYIIDKNDINNILYTYLSYMHDAYSIYEENSIERIKAIYRAKYIYYIVKNDNELYELWKNNFFNELDSFIKVLQVQKLEESNILVE